MNINRIQKTIILIYAVVIMVMCVFLVPNKIERYYHNENMIHHWTRSSSYFPIWYNYSVEHDNSVDKNAVDYAKLSLQIFAASIIAGSALIIAKK